jgi:hypothetical protein
VNLRRIAIAGVVAWAASIALGYLVNNIWLLRLYQANAWAYRRPNEIAALLPVGFGLQLLAFLAFAWAYAKGYDGEGSGVLEGVRFGVVVAIMIDGFAIVWNYVTEPIALRLGVAQLIAFVGQFGVYGAIVGAIYAPTLVPRTPNSESGIPD